MAEVFSFAVPAAKLLLGACVLYRAYLIIYRLYFHPLSKFPGPTVFAASSLPVFFLRMKGTLYRHGLKLHDEYGPVVRVAPDHLIADGSVAWSEIFRRKPNQPEFVRYPPSCDIVNGGGILTASEQSHKRQRRVIAYAFSETAIQQQDRYVQIYADLLMKRLEEVTSSGQPTDMVKWYNFTTFDIASELLFADPFGSLERSEYHPWMAMIFSNIAVVGRIALLKQYLLPRIILNFLIGAKDVAGRQQMDQFFRNKMQKRLAIQPDDRTDMMSFFINYNNVKNGVTMEELHSNAFVLAMAGSETTSTALSGLTFYLTRNPEAYKHVTEEIRSAFYSGEQITMRATASLQYLNACLEEALRMNPPAAESLPRVSPGVQALGHYIPAGTLVTICQWATYHSSRNFSLPNRFAPERWLPTTHALYDPQYANDNKEAFQPFSAGPRDCVGKKLGYGEVRLVMAKLLWNFDVEIVEGQQNWDTRQRSFTVIDKAPLLVNLKPAAGRENRD